MAEIVNLRQARKRKARAKAEAEAETNRALFGRTKAEKQREAMAQDSADKHLDGSRLDPSDDR